MAAPIVMRRRLLLLGRPCFLPCIPLQAIEAWFARGKWTSPMTNLPLRSRALVPNVPLRSLIRDNTTSRRRHMSSDNSDDDEGEEEGGGAEVMVMPSFVASPREELLRVGGGAPPFASAAHQREQQHHHLQQNVRSPSPRWMSG